MKDRYSYIPREYEKHEWRQCYHCGEYKYDTDFLWDNNTHDGLGVICKECRKKIKQSGIKL